MTINNLVKNIINLPDRFYTLGNESIYSLLEQTGYFEMHNQITEAAILEELNMFPEYINQWISWSDDKRSLSGWYFKQNEMENISLDIYLLMKIIN